MGWLRQSFLVVPQAVQQVRNLVEAVMAEHSLEAAVDKTLAAVDDDVVADGSYRLPECIAKPSSPSIRRCGDAMQFVNYCCAMRNHLAHHM